jgi:hypothetical protein
VKCEELLVLPLDLQPLGKRLLLLHSAGQAALAR